MEGIRYRDSFCWNLNEHEMSPIAFATIITRDLALPNIFIDAISTSIMRQIDSYEPITIKKDLKNGNIHPISLDIRIQDIILHDQFEWDLTSSTSNPEFFANVLVADLGLPLAFESAIAIAIRETILRYKIAIAHPNLVSELDTTTPKAMVTSRVQVYETTNTTISTSSPCVLSVLENRNKVRPSAECDQWQPIVSQMRSEEHAYLEKLYKEYTKPTSIKTQGLVSKPTSPVGKKMSTSGPRTINAFIAYCLAHRADMAASNKYGSAVEVTRVLGEQWRGLDEAQKQVYNVQAELENEKRMALYDMECRRKEIYDWEVKECREYKGFISFSDLSPSQNLVKSMFLQEYKRDRANSTT